MKTSETVNAQYKQKGIEVGQGKYHEEMIYGVGLVYASLYNQMSLLLKKYGLTPDDMNVLILAKHQGKDEGISQVDLGQRLMVTAHNMTRLIQRLEKNGLLKRAGHKKDARVKLVKITAKGSQLLDQVWPGYNKTLRDLANKISVEEQKVLAGLLQKWLDNKEKKA